LRPTVREREVASGPDEGQRAGGLLAPWEVISALPLLLAALDLLHDRRERAGRLGERRRQ
jgi:hypothetical protein